MSCSAVANRQRIELLHDGAFTVRTFYRLQHFGLPFSSIEMLAPLRGESRFDNVLVHFPRIFSLK